MSAERPDWVDNLPGFAPTGWWVPIVCTGRHHHAMEFLGVTYQHSETGQTHWSGGVVASETHPGIAPMRVWVTENTSDEEAATVRDLLGRGSMHIRCPQGCTPRIPQEAFSRLIEETRRVEPTWLDVSLYG